VAREPRAPHLPVSEGHYALKKSMDLDAHVCDWLFRGTRTSTAQTAAKKIKRETDYVHLRQKKYARAFFLKCVLGRFSTRGVRKHEICFFEYLSKKFAWEILFEKKKSFSGEILLTFFSFDFFVALVKRLSVRETQKRDKKCFAGSCV
jgi:hypothetical protein